MKRPAGLVIAAVLLILGSLLTFLMSGFMVLGAIVAPRIPATALQAAPQPSWLPVMMFVVAGLAALVAAWGSATAVGVLRFRRWARYSILTIGGCVAVFCAISALSSILLFFLPVPPAADPSQAQSAGVALKFIVGATMLFYAACAAVGIWWLFYFNSSNIRNLFAQPQLKLEPNPRPVLISILAVINGVGAIVCFAYVLLPIPALILGFALYGWGKSAVYLLFATASAAIGWGLWRLREWGRRLALGVLAFGIVNSLVYIVRPSLAAAYTAEVNRAIGIAANPLSPAYQSTMIAVSMSFGVLFLIAMAVVLIRYRAAFRSSSVLPA